MPRLHALSFDVEEWYHAELVRQRVDPARRVSLVAPQTERILDLLAQRRLRATFFITGEVVRQHPNLARAVHNGGHEIGCHSMSHRPLWQMTPDVLQAELREFRQALGDAVPGASPIGFRAPTFSLVEKTSWALEILAAEGFVYDSSIFPVANYMYGVSGGPLGVYRPAVTDMRRHDPNAPIIELPLTVWAMGGLRLAVAGGFYLRAVPMPVLMHALRRVATVRPIVLYAHPWELDTATPLVPGLSVAERFITYCNRAGALRKLERILAEFSFVPLREVLEAELTPPEKMP